MSPDDPNPDWFACNEGEVTTHAEATGTQCESRPTCELLEDDTVTCPTWEEAPCDALYVCHRDVVGWSRLGACPSPMHPTGFFIGNAAVAWCHFPDPCVDCIGCSDVPAPAMPGDPCTRLGEFEYMQTHPEIINVLVDDSVVPKSGPDGWDADGSSQSGKIVLRGATCEAASADHTTVTIQYGCPTVSQ